VSIGDVTLLLQGGIRQVGIVAGPLLAAALLVGLIVSILQASMSIQEQTLTFVPKVVAILGMLALFGGLMFTSLGQYTIQLFSRIPDMAR
jgi:flagellar biosynthetic protein FliQ